jgi:cytochrome P450
VAESELLSTSLLLLLAGHETTANLIGSAIYNLARFPEQRRRLTRSPALIDSAVEEMLRFDSPIQATRRFVQSDAIVDGKRLEAGERVLLLLGSANRDPEIFEQPEELDVGRQPNRHLAFATGGHACLGAGLARLETQIVLAELLRSTPQCANSSTARLTWPTTWPILGP